MFKKWKGLCLLLLLLFPIQIVANSLSDSSDAMSEVEDIEEKRSEDMLRYQSNQYTQPVQTEHNRVKTSILDSFELIAENEQLALYVEESSLALQIENKETGYIWNSGLDRTKEYNLNETWTNMAHSAVTINYIDEGGGDAAESILTNESEVVVNPLDDGFDAEIRLEEADISLRLEVRLVDDSLEISVPQEGIVEGENRLATLRLYPFLGAEEGTDNDAGYLFIPDGSGALMRFSEEQLASASPYRAPIYGRDLGFTRTPTSQEESRTREPQKVSLPVYGVTQAANQDAYISIIESGQSFADIVAYPSGISTDFHWITAEYNYRYQYYQPTSQSMNGYNVYQQEMNEFDVKEKITFLSNEEANYTGMAQYYKTYLKDRQLLPTVNDPADLRLEFLGGEVKSGLIWDSVLTMTEITELPQFVDQLEAKDVTDIHLVYRGWSEGGLTGTLPKKFPLESKLGSSDDFQDVNQLFEERDIPFYYYTDYTKAFEGAGNFSGRTDIGRKMNREPIFGNVQMDYYYVSPVTSARLLEADISEYQAHQINHVAIDTTGNILFSDFNASMLRQEAVTVYQDMLSQLTDSIESLSLYQPNDYLFPVMDRYLDIPMYSSNYQFVTDTVPFLQIVLKGDVPYYAPFSNFHYNPEDELLRMIEYGAYPSFYLTSQPSHELMQTPSSDLYTSEFSDWEGKIVDQYQAIKQTLDKVKGEAIRAHIVHEVGLVEVQYTNGVSIIVNYTNHPKTMNGVSIAEKSYQAVDGGNAS
ncbi:DUF5696 domain-containing protein [Gracilibacillus alcaliphilus]|uniref:DUF5696 domain-containing protein n=1 Tax=Gracilibacillus alcaliphilus TaxID=1401441 RepID=UPI0019580FEB|nr:hypothetical protein [Gracilibacillus alcaliphilus]